MDGIILENELKPEFDAAWTSEARVYLLRLALRKCTGVEHDAQDLLGETYENARKRFAGYQHRSDRLFRAWAASVLNSTWLDANKSRHTDLLRGAVEYNERLIYASVDSDADDDHAETDPATEITKERAINRAHQMHGEAHRRSIPRKSVKPYHEPAPAGREHILKVTTNIITEWSSPTRFRYEPSVKRHGQPGLYTPAGNWGSKYIWQGEAGETRIGAKVRDRVFAKLPKRVQGVAHLAGEGLTNAQIAKRIGKPESTVRSYLSRARTQLATMAVKSQQPGSVVIIAPRDGPIPVLYGADYDLHREWAPPSGRDDRVRLRGSPERREVIEATPEEEFAGPSAAEIAEFYSSGEELGIDDVVLDVRTAGAAPRNRRRPDRFGSHSDREWFRDFASPAERFGRRVFVSDNPTLFAAPKKTAA